MVVRTCVAVITAVFGVCCTPRANDLPAIKTVARLATVCRDEPRAVVALDSRSAKRPDITECVATAWASRCAGRMSLSGFVPSRSLEMALIELAEHGASADARVEALRKLLREEAAEQGRPSHDEVQRTRPAQAMKPRRR